jgi:5,10-methylenetetrahydromethanopterin reductase
VIEVAALLADGITFAVGADLGRLQWAIGLVRAARERAGLEGMPRLGAYVPIAVHDDVAAARSVLSGAVASYARFSVMHGTVAGPVDDGQRRTLEAIHGSYDMKGHFAHGSPQSQHVDEDVAEAFSIAGPPSLCIERLQELAALGITRVYVMGGSRGGDRELTLSSRSRFVQEVIPAFR